MHVGVGHTSLRRLLARRTARRSRISREALNSRACRTVEYVNALRKAAVFKSQHRPHRRSENDPPRSALWRGGGG